MAELECRSVSVERTEQDILEAARNYARVKQLQHYIEGGQIVRFSPTERDMFESHFLGKVRRCALDLLDLEAKPRL
ncbi:hypothetical protein WMF38_56990 [Sorangium sp. So ce118]